MSTPENRLRTVCTDGDIPTIEALFQELNIRPNHPVLDRQLPPEMQHLLSVCGLLECACWGKKPEALAFMYEYFRRPKVGLGYAAILRAVEEEGGNLELAKEICRIEPSQVKRSVGHTNLLVIACEISKNPDIVKVLLDAGADPNRPPEHVQFSSNASAIVRGGLPASTMDQYFDAGYKYNPHDPLLSEAYSRNRMDIIDVILTRVEDIWATDIVPNLTAQAERDKNKELFSLLKRHFPEKFAKRKGLISSLAKNFRF